MYASITTSEAQRCLITDFRRFIKSRSLSGKLCVIKTALRARPLEKRRGGVRIERVMTRRNPMTMSSLSLVLGLESRLYANLRT